jgi:hypothetical protein
MRSISQVLLDHPPVGRGLFRTVRHCHRRDHSHFSDGLIGTGHHWYFTGQTELNMALSGHQAFEAFHRTACSN